MIRKVVFGISLLALSTGSAFAATAKHHASVSRTVAEANAPVGGDNATAPATDKVEKKSKKSAKKEKAAKTDATKEIKAPAPAPMTK